MGGLPAKNFELLQAIRGQARSYLVSGLIIAFDL